MKSAIVSLTFEDKYLEWGNSTEFTSPKNIYNAFTKREFSGNQKWISYKCIAVNLRDYVRINEISDRERVPL